MKYSINVKSIFIAICYLASGLLISVGLFLLGYFFPSENKFVFSLIAIIILSMLAVFFLWNFTACFMKKKKYALYKEKCLDEISDYEMDTVERRYKELDKSVSILIFESYLFPAISLFLLLLSLYFVGLSHLKGGFYLSIVCSVFVSAIMCILIPRKEKSQFPLETYVMKEEYPEMWETIAQAGRDAGYDGKLSVVMVDNGISLLFSGYHVFAGVDPVVARFLSKDQLYAMFLYRFGLFVNDDMEKIGKTINLKNKIYDTNPIYLLDIFKITLFGYIKKVAEINFEIYKLLSAKRQLPSAYKLLTDLNQGQNYIDASAKIELFNIYTGYAWKEVVYDVYKSPVPTISINKNEYETFMKKVVEYGERWNFTLKNSIQPDISFADTFKTKMYKLNIEEYNADFKEETGNYLDEQIRLIDKADRIAMTKLKANIDGYNKLRKSRYLDYVESREYYESAVKEGKWLSDPDIIRAAQGYIFQDVNKAIELLDDVIERTGNASAYYQKATILAREYDDECIACFEKASEKPALTDNALNSIMEYTVKTGKEEFFAYYRDTVTRESLVAYYEAVQSTFNIDKIHAPTYDDEKFLKDIVKAFRGYWGNYLLGMNCVVTETETGLKNYHIALITAKTKDKKADTYAKLKATEYCQRYIGMASIKGFIYLWSKGSIYDMIKNFSGSALFKE